MNMCQSITTSGRNVESMTCHSHKGPREMHAYRSRQIHWARCWKPCTPLRAILRCC